MSINMTSGGSVYYVAQLAMVNIPLLMSIIQCMYNY